MTSRWTVTALGVMLSFGTAEAWAQPAAESALPLPPCAGAPLPDYPAPGEAVVRVWFNADIAGWRPHDCAKLGRIDANVVIATAARFRNTMDSDAVAGRVARVSNYRLIRYYSQHRERWRPMVKDAFSLTEHRGAFADPAKHRRNDFGEADLEAGRVLRYWVKDNSLLGGVVYRLTVRERTDDRLVFDIENETALTFVMVDVVPAGEFRQLHIFEREDGEQWRYYALAMARVKWFRPSVESFANRALSYFRHMAGDADAPEAQN
jgi:hypothetical protein